MNPKQTDEPIEFHMGHLLRTLGELPELEAIRTQIEGGLKQAREDAFNVMRDAMRSPGNDDRWTFLQYCLNGWIECGAQGFLIVEYDAGLSDFDIKHTPGLPKGTERRPARVLAINQGDDDYDDRAVKIILESGKVCEHCGTPLTQIDGKWVDEVEDDHCPGKGEHVPEQALFEVTHETIELGLQRIRHAVDIPDEGTGNWERNLTSVKHLGQGLRNLIIQADLTHEAGILDVWGYTMIVEVAIFGEGMYS